LYTNSAHSITPMSYTRIQEYTLSDHDPVIAMFLLEFSNQCEMTKSTKSLMMARIDRVWKINRSWVCLLMGYAIVKFLFKI
jgi:hypothetical protein